MYVKKRHVHIKFAKLQQPFLPVILIVVQLLPAISEAKTVNGVFNTFLAQAEKGQYVTTFAFHGKTFV